MSATFFFSLLAISALFALLRGGAPERWIAVILALTAVADFALVLMAGRMMTQDARILLLDVALAVVITGIALHAERLWPMLIAALLIVGAELQIGVWLAPTHQRQVYKVAHGLSAYPIILTLLVGTARHWWRTRHTPERDWTNFR
ncbi:hypothetical protein [Sphingomonas sp. Y38-1Y]|uniref:hypothetical protein n=1 Tax=Sphingomonas sp. Y38-1Y TaxID=3078265 RepID=UPI0028E6AD0B|nr:hypothetical protein [Sphingomonas sp. Y38-1Y]